ncbi:MAG: hypothetical protein CME64_01995 [Halobacteriovoraceae bacterium]|nr:hypothetical protein [Halobacteriovoraceae bacterium]
MSIFILPLNLISLRRVSSNQLKLLNQYIMTINKVLTTCEVRMKWGYFACNLGKLEKQIEKVGKAKVYHLCLSTWQF